jgi:hypothetical protein
LAMSLTTNTVAAPTIIGSLSVIRRSRGSWFLVARSGDRAEQGPDQGHDLGAVRL